MLSTLIFGLASSLVAELIVWLNQKLSGTVLKGDAAWLLAAAVAIIAATVKVVAGGVPTNWSMFATECATIWTVSHVFFVAIVQQFNLDVQSS